MPSTPAFGPIVTRTQVADAVEDTLKLWQHEYLSEIAFQTGRVRGTLPEVKAWERSEDDLRKHVASNLPCVIIRVLGTSDEPVKREKRIDAPWSVIVSVVCKGTSQRDTEELADAYTAAFRALMLHNRTLGGFSSHLRWIDERYGEIPSDDRDTLGAGSAVYEVEVDGVVRPHGPGGVPLADPYGTVRGPNPVAEETFVTTTPMED